ncbi:MAG: GMC family oxidoreductase [Hyphomicrobiales bacterium]|nr:GMC family oxidoreductase [Hyphomicrobiales bacterium]
MRSVQSRTSIGSFDYVIVGAGSAGCVLANRLSADPGKRVLLLEAGGHDRRFWVNVPIGYLYCMGNPATDWCFKTEPEAGLNGRAINYPRGKLLGGCSSINGMIYMRGQAQDYNLWRQHGNPGWGWTDVLPYFLKSEDHATKQSVYHAQGGELRIEKQRLKWPILDAVREAAQELGIPQVDDFNSGTNGGSGYFEVNQRRGVRWSASRAFLAPVRTRRNLTIMTHTHVERLIFDGHRAIALDYRHKGEPGRVHANGEIILSAGAIGSPKILEMSGIGDGDVLRRAGIDVFLEMPGVGENLQDHLQIRSIFRIQNARTLNEMQSTLWGRMKILAEYAFRQSGPMAMAPSQLGIFARSHPRYSEPNIEYHVQPLSLDRFGEPLHKFPALTLSVCNLRPQSRGHVHVVSPDFDEPPKISPNYLSADEDRMVAVSALRHARRLMRTRRMHEFSPKELLPGVEIQSEDELIHAVGDIATTIFHPVGTVKMGQDHKAVVGHTLKVHGLEGLRVVDASIMPTIISGNTHAPVVMIAEKAAEMIARNI